MRQRWRSRQRGDEEICLNKWGRTRSRWRVICAEMVQQREVASGSCSALRCDTLGHNAVCVPLFDAYTKVCPLLAKDNCKLSQQPSPPLVVAPSTLKSHCAKSLMYSIWGGAGGGGQWVLVDAGGCWLDKVRQKGGTMLAWICFIQRNWSRDWLWLCGRRPTLCQGLQVDCLSREA